MDTEDEASLHAAAKASNLSLAESVLLSANGSSAARKKDPDGRLPIHWAASANSVEIAALLTDGERCAEVDAQDDSGWTPLMISASRPNGENMVKLLLRRGAAVNLKNNSGQTALHFAASKNNVDVVKALLSHDTPASISVRDKLGQQPIHRAAAAGSIGALALLIESKSPLSSTDICGFTPLHHAVAEGHAHTAVMLVKSGADQTGQNSEGQPPFDLAPDSGVRRLISDLAEEAGIKINM